MRFGALFALMIGAISVASPAYPQPGDEGSAHAGLAGDTLLIIRHAEKPTDGSSGLTPAGQHRAQAYSAYFSHGVFDGSAIRLTDLVAAADSAKSVRPRLTLTPLSKVLDLPIQQPFAEDKVEDLARWLANGPPHRTMLISWRHHKIAKLLAALAADPAKLLPAEGWPNDVYDWVIVLKYDARGRLESQSRTLEPDLNL